MDDLARKFSALPPLEKGAFLAGVAHMATITARDAYLVEFARPDGEALRTANEFVHRVTGYTMHVLDHTAQHGQDTDMIALISDYFTQRRLAWWLKEHLPG